MENITEGHVKRYFIILALFIIFFSIIGVFLYLYNNPKYIITSVINSAGKNITKYFDKVNKTIPKTFITETEIDFSYFKMQDLNKIKLYTNINNENEYNIYELSKGNGESIANIYEKQGIVYLDFLNYDKFIRLNDIPINYRNEEVTKNLDKIYSKVYRQIIKELKDDDFYKIGLQNEGKNINRVQFGLNLSQTRVKEVIINSLEHLKQDIKFINDLAEINMILNKEEKQNINNEYVLGEIEKYINQVKQIEANEKINYEISFVVSGILNRKIESIKVSCENEKLIYWNIDVMFNKDQVELNFDYNGNSYLYVNALKKTETSYVINIKDNNKDIKHNYDINVDINLEGVITYNGKILDNKFDGRLEVKPINKVNNINFSLNTVLFQVKSNTNIKYEKVNKEINIKEEQSYNEYKETMALD